MDGKEMPFLRDIDDDKLFADRLENVYTLTYEYLGEALATFPIIFRNEDVDRYVDWFTELTVTYEKLARMRHTMSRVIRDMADRKRRLGDAARGLSDVEFEKD